jgi:hypothetical protein
MMRLFRGIVCAGLAFGVITAAAQNDSNAAGQNDADASAQTDSNLPGKPPPCRPNEKLYQFHVITKDRPYSAKRVSTCQKKLEDGTVYSATRTVWEWRDSEGRMRVAQRDSFPEGPHWFSVTVVDPVAHLQWGWNEGKGVDKAAFLEHYDPKIDYVLPEPHWNILPDGNVDPPIYARMVNPDTPAEKQVTLKPANVNGVWAEGERLIQRVKPGMGNNKSNQVETVVNEFWESVDLMVEVRQVADDPELGKMIDNLVDIDESEPDARLFRPPEGYRILEVKPRVVDQRPNLLILTPGKEQPPE